LNSENFSANKLNANLNKESFTSSEIKEEKNKDNNNNIYIENKDPIFKRALIYFCD